MRNTLLLTTAALALSLTGVAAFASSTSSPDAPNLYAPDWRSTSSDVRAPRAVLAARVGTYSESAYSTAAYPVIQNPQDHR